MTITTQDIKFFASKVMSDVPEGGGGPSAVVLQSGKSNNIFRDVREQDRAGGNLSMLLKSGQQKQLSFELSLLPSVAAPVQKGDVLGEITVLLSGRAVAKVPAVAAESVPLPGFLNGLMRLFGNWK